LVEDPTGNWQLQPANALTRNPMLLSLSALLHLVQFELPDNRAILHRACIELLCHALGFHPDRPPQLACLLPIHVQTESNVVVRHQALLRSGIEPAFQFCSLFYARLEQLQARPSASPPV